MHAWTIGVAFVACLVTLVPGLVGVAAASSPDDDFYTILGVDRDASTREIRKGFKRVALVRHPDKNRVGRERSVVESRSLYSVFD